MTTTRSGATSEPGPKSGNGRRAGSKHQLDTETSPSSKRTMKNDDMKQREIEDTIPRSYGDGKAQTSANGHKETGHGKNGGDKHIVETCYERERKGSAERGEARKGTVPSNILEKGIIYFFVRGRVGIDEPSNVDDIRRSYIVLRPLEKDAKLSESTINDAGNSRLIAIPKKIFPLSGRDRWIAFVEKSHASFGTLKHEFLSASDYTTKTAGVRHSPAATPVAEGIYAITTTGRESHLTYMITLPSHLGEVQTDLGLRENGSFIISTRNPAYEAPKGTSLPQGPDYPREAQDEFRALRWIATQPKHLDFPNTQFLLIGETGGIKKATELQKNEEGHEEPIKELEKLENEDTKRMEALQGDDSAAIFADLQARAKDFPKLQTTF
ncbi:hypothetical protein AAE478_006397 [Parahypoxylon ruwenzoriense]